MDKNFLKEAQIKGKFHARTWEMFIASFLMDNKFVCSKYFKKKGGPELIIKNLKGEELAYIECVAPADGKSIGNIVPKCFITETPTLLSEPPYQHLILRLTNSIENKIAQYKKWQNKLTGFKVNLPYILAINLGDPDIHWSNVDENIIQSALFNAKIRDGGTIAYRRFQGLIKFPRLGDFLNKKGKKISTEYFLNRKCEFISAIIFSTESVLNQSEILGDSNFIIFNPFAKNKLSPALFPFLRQFSFVSIDENIVTLRTFDISNEN